MPDNITKMCRTCGAELDLSLFSKNGRNKDGYRYSCKPCEKKKAAEYYKNNSRRITEKVEKWQEDNADKVRGYKRDYYRRGTKAGQDEGGDRDGSDF
jgi:hypothetical protein